MTAYQRICPEERTDIAALRDAGLSLRQIAAEVGRSVSSVSAALARQEDEYGGAPSPEEIRRRCREVRTEWDEKTRLKRAGITAPEPWLPPLVKVAELADYYAE